MIERAIENWLINTNEKNYQVALCQSLQHKGQKIIHSSSHRPMEQGKDIISLDESGNCFAYQLKTGDIDLAKWRAISGEIRELIELPIIHPSVDKTKVHKSFLVTNGQILDEVRIQIDQINEDNTRKGRNYSYLDVICKQALLKEFLDAQGEFIPRELEDFRSFLELFLSEGKDFLKKEEYFNFLNNIIFREITGQKSKFINAISSSVIITAYLLNPYQTNKNYYSIFEAWTILATSIVRYAYQTKLDERDWRSSLDLVISEIIRNLILLKEDALGRTYLLEGQLLGDGGIIYNARVTIVLGAISALEIYLHVKSEGYSPDAKFIDLIKTNKDNLFLWGESAFQYFFNIINYLEIEGEKEIAESIINILFEQVVNINVRTGAVGLPDPYYSLNEILDVIFQVTRKQIDFTQFRGSSYILESLVLMLVRRNKRQILEQNWRNLSYVRLREFRPQYIEDTFAWHTEFGVNHDEFPKATQSWSELVKEAWDLKQVPSFYVENSELLRFILLVYPHRINKNIINLLDQEALKLVSP